jgi:hypothetical protein
MPREKGRFLVTKADARPKVDCNSPNSQSKQTNGVKRKNVRRQHMFASDEWYEKAALSTAISATINAKRAVNDY